MLIRIQVIQTIVAECTIFNLQNIIWKHSSYNTNKSNYFPQAQWRKLNDPIGFIIWLTNWRNEEFI